MENGAPVRVLVEEASDAAVLLPKDTFMAATMARVVLAVAARSPISIVWVEPIVTRTCFSAGTCSRSDPAFVCIAGTIVAAKG